MELSICISQYGSIDYLTKCLQSILRNPPRCQYEIVVIDDASPENCREIIQSVFPGVRVLVNPRNLGFAGSNNRGIRESSGRYVLLLNNDTEVLPDSLEALIGFMESHRNVGAVGPRLLNSDLTFQPQCKRGLLSPMSGLMYSLGLDRRFPQNRRLGEYLMTYADPHQAHDVKGLSGACLLVRREVIEKVGLLDESFGMYGEDLDLCYRIGAAGWRVCYSPSAQVVHHGGKGGSAALSFQNLYLYHRALWILFQRYPQTKYFAVYGWLAWIAIAVRFAGCVSLNALRRDKRVGTAKGGEAGAKRQ